MFYQNVSWFTLILVVICSALVLYVIARIRTSIRQKKEFEADCESRRERERQFDEKQKAENISRAIARKQWLAENPRRLYCKTLDGITAVLRPVDYENCQKLTATNRRNGFWEKENVLCLARPTVIFVTKQGKDLVVANTSSSPGLRCSVSGWLSDLDAIVAQGVELVRMEDIFVPWVNETIIPFAEQAHLLSDGFDRGTYYELVERQAPPDLLPV